MSEMELSPDGKYIYVRIACAVLKIDAVSMQEVERYQIMEESVELLKKYEKFSGRMQ